jgi:hypothetical protein
MPEFPFKDLEDLLASSLDPRGLRKKFGLPHPLHKFATNGGVKDNAYADAILEFLNDHAWSEPGSPRQRGAVWFLFESEKAFFVACEQAGIDADRFREHLRKCQAGEVAAD